MRKSVLPSHVVPVDGSVVVVSVVRLPPVPAFRM